MSKVSAGRELSAGNTLAATCRSKSDWADKDVAVPVGSVDETAAVGRGSAGIGGTILSILLSAHDAVNCDGAARMHDSAPPGVTLSKGQRNCASEMLDVFTNLDAAANHDYALMLRGCPVFSAVNPVSGT